MVRVYWINVGSPIKVSSTDKFFVGKMAAVVAIVGKCLFDIFINSNYTVTGDRSKLLPL